tara:strand:- start:449 stop:1456 length:1008 start_codon:yes stop_codon:yes gene_type:complete
MIMKTKLIKNLSYIGAFFTLLVISAGAWVRLTDAGLGCPDWPGCYGILGTPDTDEKIARAKEFYPDATIDVGKAWREMFHRYLAGILGLYVFFISFLTYRYAKHVSIFLPISLSILIIVQSLMGMLTVTELVKPTIVTTHLILGMTTACLLLWNGLRIGSISDTSSSKFNAFVKLCIIALVIQIILGGWTSTNYASLACPDFPKCTEQWWPDNMNFDRGFTIFGLPNVNYEVTHMEYYAKLAVHFTHRVGALLLSILFLGLFSYIFFMQKSQKIKNIGYLIFAFFSLQIYLGISNVVYSLPLNIAVLHTVNACILLMSMLILLFNTTYKVQGVKS